MKKSPVKSIVAIGIGAALFFVLGRFVAIPSPVPNTNISIQYGFLAFMSVLFGPLEGLLIGFIGHALIDFSYGWGVWWSWVIASGIFGILMGLGSMVLRIGKNGFSKADIIKFNVTQIIAHIICWGAAAPMLDIAIYAEPVEKLFAQGLVSALANIVTTAIVGTILVSAYLAAKPKKGSLKEEQ
ncbi:MAG: ECF-type riboflavin transporter substrate-binding protein [Lachnospiraceae bacterium]|nr:ECF-type riboflavin transporter substrate-binding protein [Lachnospiraceae bacterium]